MLENIHNVQAEFTLNESTAKYPFITTARKGWCNSLAGRALTTNRKCVKFLLHPERVYMYISQKKNSHLAMRFLLHRVHLKRKLLMFFISKNSSRCITWGALGLHIPSRQNSTVKV